MQYSLDYGVQGKGGVRLEWQKFPECDPNCEYEVYRKQNNADWEEVSLDPTDEEFQPIHVLNVYPTSGEKGYFYDSAKTTTLPNILGTANIHKSASLKVWMEGGYYNSVKFEPAGAYNGKNKILVDMVPFTSWDVDGEAEKYMYGKKNNNGGKPYDVTLLGTWDSNGGCKPSDSSLEAIKKYLNDGYGFVAGHDTVDDHTKNTMRLIAQEYFGINPTGNAPYGYYAKTARIWKSGFLTMFPNWLGGVGTNLTIQNTHTSTQYVNGAILWMSLYSSSWNKNEISSKGYTKESFPFLTSYGNAAFTQTGHSNCNSEWQERQILANTIFSMAHKTKLNHLIDQVAWDYDAPNIPTVEIIRRFNRRTQNRKTYIDVTLKVKGVDVGTTYKYKVKETTTGDFVQPQTSVIAKSGMAKVCHTIDTSPSTSINPVENAGTCHDYNEDYQTTVTIQESSYYFHVFAMDKNDNYSPLLHFYINGKEMSTQTFSMDYIDVSTQDFITKCLKIVAWMYLSFE
jgi:hypothetical protein